jgi:hypothetical protein
VLFALDTKNEKSTVTDGPFSETKEVPAVKNNSPRLVDFATPHIDRRYL